MATPIETNTEELQEILNTVYNLPMAGGGSSEPDLVITAAENFAWANPNQYPTYNWGKILFDPNAVISTYEKHMAGKDVRAVFGGFFPLNSAIPRVMTTHPHARIIGYGPDVYNSGNNCHYLVVRFHVYDSYYFLSNDGTAFEPEYRFIISSDMSTATLEACAMWNVT